jgi:hypothetical protein
MPKKKMRLVYVWTLVPIFTDEYAIRVCIGPRALVESRAAKYLGASAQKMHQQFDGNRGLAVNALPDRDPIILVDGEMPRDQILATLAHEASHAMDYIGEHLAIRNGEFHAHGLSVVMRRAGALVR